VKDSNKSDEADRDAEYFRSLADGRRRVEGRRAAAFEVRPPVTPESGDAIADPAGGPVAPAEPVAVDATPIPGESTPVAPASFPVAPSPAAVPPLPPLTFPAPTFRSAAYPAAGESAVPRTDLDRSGSPDAVPFAVPPAPTVEIDAAGSAAPGAAASTVKGTARRSAAEEQTASSMGTAPAASAEAQTTFIPVLTRTEAAPARRYGRARRADRNPIPVPTPPVEYRAPAAGSPVGLTKEPAQPAGPGAPTGPIVDGSRTPPPLMSGTAVRPILVEQPTEFISAINHPAPQAPGAAETVTCPECGLAAIIDTAKRQSDDFCRACDFPLFWARSTVIAPSGAETGASLRRLPGTVGRAATAGVPCPFCSEPNSLSAQICVRCGRSMHPVAEPEPTYLPPPPLPEPEPEPIDRTWIWVLVLCVSVLAIAVILAWVLIP